MIAAFCSLSAVNYCPCPCGKPASRRPTWSSSAFLFSVQAHIAQDEAPQQRDNVEQVPRRPKVIPKHQESAASEHEQVSRKPKIMQKSRESSAPTSIKAHKREALLQRRAVELEEEAKKIDLDTDKLLKQGDPSSVQAVVKEIVPVGLFLTMPNGKEGFLPSTDFEFSGGIVILRRLFKVDQVLTVKVLHEIGGGREMVTMRKDLSVGA